MFGNIFSKKGGDGAPSRPCGPFFSKTDWLSFWGATAVSMLVYFFTLGPSVGMEDSGELATAGDWLGVPHPPGYPLWTMCAWVFCRVFGWVTYQGHPTPAWAISLMSAVFGALAAGCTAMLITSSARDMLRGEAGEGASDRHRDMMALAGGLGGSLVFAFSPVMWSQATIVEIYSLNALFLMWVLLLTYRWMRRPSDKILWLTAFVFGLGLTNYQVLLFAAVPLVLVILTTEIRLFRDFTLLLVPIGLTAHLLSVVSREDVANMPGKRWIFGQAQNSSIFASATARPQTLPYEVAKFNHLGDVALQGVPDSTLLWTGAILVVAAAAVAAAMRRRAEANPGRWRADMPALAGACTALAGVAAMLLSRVFSVTEVWFGAGPAGTFVYGRSAPRTWPESQLAGAPLASPDLYLAVGVLLSLSIACALYVAFRRDKTLREIVRDALDGTGGPSGRIAGFAAAGMALFAAAAAVAPLVALDAAGVHGAGKEFSWLVPGLVLAAGIAVVWALTWKIPRGAAYAIPVTGAQLAFFALAVRGALNGLTDPNTWWFFWPVLWNFAALGLAWAALPNGRRVAFAAFFAELGVSFYAYMPIVSDLRNPPMNWAYPRTWKGFKHAITRGQYEAIGFLDGGFEKLGDQFGSYLSDLRMQFTLVAATLALLPFAAWKWRNAKGRARSALNLAAALYIAVAALVVASEIYGGEPPWRVDKLLIAALGALAATGAVAILCRQTAKLLAGGADAGATVRKADAAGDAAEGEGRDAAKPADLSHPPRFCADDISQRWLLCTGAGFVMMSFVLIMLANTRGDIQDGFIQKVKFISSHGIFSLWIGCGLAFGLAVANRWLAPVLRDSPFRRPVLGALLAAASLTFLIPVYENYTNDDLIMRMGSAEQNGHTFGWQFGAYQLEGNRAIAPELSPDEEPLPNPDWPPPMTKDAFFFGGSDPGRFVPTYMIYSADYRPDVHLITQNALADGTYMSVERDLYGDDIWIPDTADSQLAFEQYDKENPGSSAHGKIEVQGALEVMKINAILARQMFDRERLRRDFYIEESYPIQWMYPYLTPHGLIMKIEGDPSIDGKSPFAVRMPPATVRSDMDFWDWYTRRLLRDPAFRRDFAAQKNFSKLRSAIAMLYYNRGMDREFAEAAREACHLYPISTESVIRYFQTSQLRGIRLHADPKTPPDAMPDLVFLADGIDRAHSGMAYLSAIDQKHEVARMYTERARETVEILMEAAREKRNPSTRECVKIATALCGMNRPDLTLPFLRTVLADSAYTDFQGLSDCTACAAMLRLMDIPCAFAQKLMTSLAARGGEGERWLRDPANADGVKRAALVSLEGAIQIAGRRSAGAEADRAVEMRLLCSEFFFKAYAKAAGEPARDQSGAGKGGERFGTLVPVLASLRSAYGDLLRSDGDKRIMDSISRSARACAAFVTRRDTRKERIDAVKQLAATIESDERAALAAAAKAGRPPEKAPGGVADWRAMLGDSTVNAIFREPRQALPAPGGARRLLF